MDAYQILKKSFDDEVDSLFKEKPAIHSYIKNHERKNLCIENIAKEVRLIELTRAIKLDRNRLEFLGKTYVKTFASIAIAHAEENLKSESKKIQERRARDEAAEFEEMFNNEVKISDRSIG
jgi:hypothetical protein